jgi:hypothetical protein
MKNLGFKILLFNLFLCLFFFFLKQTCLGQLRPNYVGINIGDHFREVDQAAEIVGPGGWIVVMACPSDAPALSAMFQNHPEINFVLRGHYPRRDPDDDWALEWAATLANMNTGNHKIFFVPWNDVNNLNSGCSSSPGGDGGLASDVEDFTTSLRQYFIEAGAYPGKVSLLTPAFNLSNGNCPPTQYIQQLEAIHPNYIGEFEGIAANYYDFERRCDEPLCETDWRLNPIMFQTFLDEIGSNGPMFLQETGVVLNEPVYQDGLFEAFFQRAYARDEWNANNFMMEAVFSYDPEHQEPWSIYGSNTSRVLSNRADQLSSHVHNGGGNLNPDFVTDYGLTLCDNGISYYVSDPNDCVVCGGGIVGIPELELDLPPNRVTEWGSTVNGRNIPCRPLISDQNPWNNPDNLQCYENYFNRYYYNWDPIRNCHISGYPYDYSPWRPFPGDAGRIFYNPDDTPVPYDDQNVCYDLTRLNETNDKNRSSDYYITTYCNPAPEIHEVFQWFPCVGGQPCTLESLQKYMITFGRYRPWWTDRTGTHQATQIPFLGNSLTSSREFFEASQRMSLFLTDFLRGTAYWDRKRINPENPTDHRRVLDESGPIRKLYPKQIFNHWDYYNAFLACRVFKDQSSCRSPLLHYDWVHDYVMIYSDDLGQQILSRGDEGFSDLPDRRDGNPFRLSSFYCALPSATDDGEGPRPPFATEAVCPPQEDFGPESIFWVRTPEYYPHFPLTSREDVPAIVDVFFENAFFPPGVGDPNDPNYDPDNPAGSHPWGIELGHYPPTIEEYYEIIENHGGFYYRDLGLSEVGADLLPGVPRVFDEPLPWYELHIVDLVFIPYIAESRELGEWAGLPLTPHGLDWDENQTVNTLQLPNTGDCEIGEVARGGPGDVLANDWRHKASASQDPERMLWMLSEAAAAVEDQPEWGCQDGQPWVFPERTTYHKRSQGEVTTKIPYLKQIAQRLIGEAGVFKTLMPYSFNNLVLDTISQITDGQVYPWELPGYGPAYHQYKNDLTREPDAEEHWGCCEPQWSTCQPFTWCTSDGECDFCDGGRCVGDPGYCRSMPSGDCAQITHRDAEGNPIIGPDGDPVQSDAPCDCAGCGDPDCGPVLVDPEAFDYQGQSASFFGPRDYRGWGEISNNDEARFYYPYIGAIDIFRRYLMNQMVPHEQVRF